MDNFLTDYIKAIENPNKVGWNGKVWTAPNLKGYDSNQRGYGIDINTNKAAKKLTEGRSGKWLTDQEATNLMNQHINYIDDVAKRKIKGYESFSPKKKAAVLGMLYRGDSVTQNINLDEQDEDRFIDSIYNYYKSKGLNERIKNSQNFFNKNIKSKLTTPPDWSKIIPVWEPPIQFKEGGKMNTIKFLKNGSGIHIKKKNRGKFTKSAKAAGESVQEHARKVLANPNATPLQKKRANFARNARKWKHKEGGIVKAQDGTKTNFFTKASNWFSNNKDLVSNIGQIGTNLISGLKQNKAIDSQIEANNAQMEADKAASWMNNYKKALLQQTDRSDIVNSHNAFQIANSADYSNNKLQKENLKLAQSKTNPTGDFLSSLGGIVSDFFNKKNSTTPAPTTSTTPTTFSTPTTDLGNGFSYNLNTGMTYKPTWNSMLKYQFGGKYFQPSVKTAYGYPVYWSDEVPSRYKWAKEYLKNHPDVTGFAVGGGAQGPGDDGPREIIRNSHSSYIPDHNDYNSWYTLDKIEAIRHYMDETGYVPNFEQSPKQKKFRKDHFTSEDGYGHNDIEWKKSIISRIEGIKENDKEFGVTPEQFRDYANLMRGLNSKMDNYYNIPNEYRGGYYLPEVNISSKKHYIGIPLIKNITNEYKSGGSIHSKSNYIGEIQK